MNKVFLNTVNQELIQAIKTRYKLPDSKVLALSEAGRSSVINSLKAFVLKNGTAEIEAVLLDKKPFNNSSLKPFCFSNFEKDIAEKHLLDKVQTHEIADFSINYLIDKFKEGFIASGNTRDLDGICKFLEIDKKMIGLVNSPFGKILGKFF
jgi:hypothetical protein